MPISLILTPFDHFHFRPTLGLLSSHKLTVCPMHFMVLTLLKFRQLCEFQEPWSGGYLVYKQLCILRHNLRASKHAEGTETQDRLVYCRWPLAQKMSSKPIEIIITIIDYYINQSINRNNMKVNQ